MTTSNSLEQLHINGQRIGANKMLLKLLQDKVIKPEVAKKYMIKDK